MLTAENVHAKVLKSATLVDQIEETIEKQLRSQWALKMAVSEEADICHDWGEWKCWYWWKASKIYPKSEEGIQKCQFMNNLQKFISNNI